MKTLRKIGNYSVKYICYILVILVICIPILSIVGTSFKSLDESIDYDPQLFPKRFTVNNYVEVFTEFNFPTFVTNSLIVTLSTVVISMFLATLCAFAISFLPYRFGRWISKLVVLMRMMPTLITSIALFVIYAKLKLLNTHAALILTYVAGAGGCQIACTLIQRYMGNTSKDLLDAAYIDGASTFQAFWKIVLPISIPGLLCTAIYVFIGIWKEYPMAANLTTDLDMLTLPIGLQLYVGSYITNWPKMMAVSVIIAVPALVLFSTIQNFFIDHMAGAVKD